MASIAPPIHSYSRKTIGARLVNCYAEQAPANSKAQVRLIGAPGIAEYQTVGSRVRGMLSLGDTLYIVSDTMLYSMNTNGVSTALGEIPGSDHVKIKADRSDIIILSNGRAYVWDGTTVTRVTDTDYLTSSDMEVLENWVLFIKEDSDYFFAADFGFATDYSALNFAIAESSPDKLLGFIADHGQLILAGAKTIEVYWYTGAEGFPFERIPNGVLEVGCSAGKSLAKADNSVFWLDDTRIVRRLTDLTPIRVSQYGVEEAIAGYATVDDAMAFTYTDEGHIFYVLNFPTQKATWIYDISTGEWAERETIDEGYWHISHYAYFNNKHLVSEAESGRIGIMSASTYTEFGKPLRMEWAYPSIYAGGNSVKHSKFQVVTKVGHGDSPALGLSYSDDGGRTFNAMPTRSMGAIGEYQTRTQWHRLGSSRDRVYQCFISDPVERYIQDTQVTVSG